MSELFATLPKKWKVGSYTFGVHLFPTNSPEIDGVDGHTDFAKQMICLDESMSAERAAVVVLHEAIHVINWVFGVTDDSSEEEFTTQVSTGLMSFWKINPRVMTWLNKARKLKNA